jgi:transposase InsO family protein
VSRRIGTSMGVYGSLHPPGRAQLSHIKDISKAAQQRLKWIDHYRQKGKNGRATCRHFGISPSLFYKWYKRFEHQGLAGLEERSRCPRTFRESQVPLDQIDLIKRLRKQYPYYSKYKLQVILKRDHDVQMSVSTVGRVIKKYNLFFASPYPRKKDRHKYKRERLPKGFQALKPGDLIQSDTKHISFFGPKRYWYVIIDCVTKIVSIHVSSSPTSRQAQLAVEKAQRQFPFAIRHWHNDNGSENLKHLAQYLHDQQIPQYFSRPRTPKDDAFVERMIGTIERECIEQGKLAFDIVDQQRLVDEWLVEYHTFRPHQALAYLTPYQFYEKLSA